MIAHDRTLKTVSIRFGSWLSLVRDFSRGWKLPWRQYGDRLAFQQESRAYLVNAVLIPGSTWYKKNTYFKKNEINETSRSKTYLEATLANEAGDTTLKQTT